ncbi:MAG: hypothetical protein LBO82_06965 [Synergistaceae bacterium]|nr:hypothetical protein [Synergistaceae bacterium]
MIYRLFGDEAAARRAAEDIRVEQTVEFPYRALPDGTIRDEVTGRIESFDEEKEGTYLAEISFADETAAGELTQFLNVAFGNISIKRGIQIAGFIPGEGILSLCPGPRFGVSGIRKLTGVAERPMIFSALKPMGLSSADLAGLAWKLAEGGVDVIKDDHGLTNQVFAPFEERVACCAEAVREANARFGRSAIYVPNVTAPAGLVMKRARKALECGAGGLLIAPGIAGFGAMLELAASDMDLPVFAHPALMGSYAINRDGIEPAALFGTLMRIFGADVTIFPNHGGRFPLTKEECLGIARACREKLGNLGSIFPSPAGGIEFSNIAELVGNYGNDFLLLAGGGLFTCGEDLVSNCNKFHDEVLKASSNLI